MNKPRFEICTGRHPGDKECSHCRAMAQLSPENKMRFRRLLVAMSITPVDTSARNLIRVADMIP